MNDANTMTRFTEYADDAGNWNGTPLVGGNVGGDPADKGFILNMKKQGLVETDEDEDGNVWMFFTEKGRKLALAMEIDIPA
jgi:Ser-tRNA(Ala) deacylase AlaX